MELKTKNKSQPMKLKTREDTLKKSLAVKQMSARTRLRLSRSIGNQNRREKTLEIRIFVRVRRLSNLYREISKGLADRAGQRGLPMSVPEEPREYNSKASWGIPNLSFHSPSSQ